jgi:hypothetical protein
VRWSAVISLPPPALAREPEAPYGPGGDSHEPPALELRPYTPEELWRLFRGGEREADAVEARLVRAARARCGLWLRIGQGLHALQQGRRLQELAFRFADYARELRIGRSRGYELAAFAEDLETRPLLREAVRSGRVKYRAAQEVMPLAVGEAEARWVERAATETVRALEREVREQSAAGAAADEPWFRMVTGIAPEHRVVVDEALRLAGRLMPEASASGRYEAIAQEYLGEFAGEADDGQVAESGGEEPADGRREGQAGGGCEGRTGGGRDEQTGGGQDTAGTPGTWQEDARALGGSFRRSGLRAELDEARAARLEAETDAWTHLPPAEPLPAPDVDFDAMTSAQEIDRELRRLVRQDQEWDEIMGHDAHALEAGGVFRIHGFASFKQYAEERLGLPYRPVARRAKLEAKLWASPALQEARRQKLGFEKLWMISFLPEAEIASIVPRARAMTVIALRRALDRAEETRMRGQGKVKALVPRSVAYLLAAAMAAARERVDRPISDGQCLAIIAAHFVRTYEALAKRRLTNSQRVRERDGGWCTVPGCSAHAVDAHHIQFRSRGGHRTALWNQAGLCAFHHTCIHEFGLRLEGRAPDALRWTLRGRPFTGR